MTFHAAAGAQARERLEEDYRSGRTSPYPHRITLALDIRELYGPEVDVACLAVEPAVDEWEAGRQVPSWEQLAALAALTEFPLEFFFQPADAAESSPVIICQRSGRGRGCRVIAPADPVPRAQDLAPVVPLGPR